MVNFTVKGQEAACKACNCRVNNVEALSELIEAKIAAARAKESGKLHTYM